MRNISRGISHEFRVDFAPISHIRGFIYLKGENNGCGQKMSSPEKVPFSACEEYGWAPLDKLPASAYDEASDMCFHDPAAPQTPEDVASTYFTLQPGQFAIFFPQDGHAPAITATGLRKAIIKVKA